MSTRVAAPAAKPVLIPTCTTSTATTTWWGARAMTVIVGAVPGAITWAIEHKRKASE